jgi:hypothetical protein
MPRTYLYKLTSDRGGAPSAPPPARSQNPLLTLAICKPAIRRTAEAGDRIVGLTSRALEQSDGYPPASVIYAAVVEEGIDAREYFAVRGQFQARPDCIYRFHRMNGAAADGTPVEAGTITHRRKSRLHAAPEHLLRDLGRYPFYRNGRVLTATDFRYFGSEAVIVPPRLSLLREAAETLGQGHRVYDSRLADDAAMLHQLDLLFKQLWKLPTRYTLRIAAADAYDH